MLDVKALEIGPKPQALATRPGTWLADESSALLSATPDPSWAEGALSVASRNRATRGVAMARLPKALRAWLGRPVRVLGASGTVCETRLQRFLIRAEISPDLRTAEHWEGCADGPAIPPQAIAEEVWRLSERSGRTLIGEFSAPCKGALFAVDPDLPTPAIAAPRPASAEGGAALMTAFRLLPAYARVQARFHTEQPAAEGAWDDHDARSSVSTLELPGRAPLSFVSVEVGSGCSGFSASLSAVWTSDGSGWALQSIDDRRITPSAIVDLDGSGGVVLLGPDGPFHARSVLRPPSYARTFLSSVPFLPGPC